MPTFKVTCTECGGEKWPTLPEFPSNYVCVLCRSIPQGVGAKRRDAAAKRKK